VHIPALSYPYIHEETPKSPAPGNEFIRLKIFLKRAPPQKQQKTSFAKHPDLLCAPRLYPTGDNGANAIHITGVSDNDNGGPTGARRGN
jgi:hypothetical protein